MPSQVIEKAIYNRESQTLDVWFRPSGKRYKYFEVPMEMYDAYNKAFSKGRFFNKFIRDHYRFESEFH
jgi:hypothetical protein